MANAEELDMASPSTASLRNLSTDEGIRIWVSTRDLNTRGQRPIPSRPRPHLLARGWCKTLVLVASHGTAVPVGAVTLTENQTRGFSWGAAHLAPREPPEGLMMETQRIIGSLIEYLRE